MYIRTVIALLRALNSADMPTVFKSMERGGWSVECACLKGTYVLDAKGVGYP